MHAMPLLEVAVAQVATVRKDRFVWLTNTKIFHFTNRARIALLAASV